MGFSGFVKDALSRMASRTTMFCSAFFVTGNVMHWFHRLDATYITFMTALLGAVIGHSVKEDVFAGRNGNGKPPQNAPTASAPTPNVPDSGKA